jgi:hypothetical protein
MTTQQKMEAKIASRSTASLKEMAVALYSDVRAESALVLSMVLDALMCRIPEAEFVSFCAKMEG